MKNEIWKDIPGFPPYKVSDMGRIEGPRGISFGSINNHGYRRKVLYYVSGAKASFGVHRLVMSAFVGDGKGLEVNHLNGVKHDNRLENLEYVTRSGNMKHAYLSGLSKTKLKEQDVLAIMCLLKCDFQNMYIAKLFNVSDVTISLIKRRRQWTHIDLTAFEAWRKGKV